jgi:hypothetical protein
VIGVGAKSVMITPRACGGPGSSATLFADAHNRDR